MLQIRPSCEHCDKDLLNNNTEAMICTFECTFCSDCVNLLLKNVCPNCGGGFSLRPIRPSHLLEKYPPIQERIHKPKPSDLVNKLIARFENIKPEDR